MLVYVVCLFFALAVEVPLMSSLLDRICLGKNFKTSQAKTRLDQIRPDQISQQREGGRERKRESRREQTYVHGRRMLLAQDVKIPALMTIHCP